MEMYPSPHCLHLLPSFLLVLVLDFQYSGLHTMISWLYMFQCSDSEVFLTYESLCFCFPPLVGLRLDLGSESERYNFLLMYQLNFTNIFSCLLASNHF